MPVEPVMYPPVDRSAPLPPAPIDHRALSRPQRPPRPVTAPPPVVVPAPTVAPAGPAAVAPAGVAAPGLPEPVTAVPVPVTAVPVTAVPVTAVTFPVPAHPGPGFPLPAYPVPASPAPVHAPPPHPVPARAMPVHAVPAHAVPAHAVPAHAVPAHAVPAHAVPARTMPAHTVPAHPVPAHVVPVRAMPVHAMPARTGPAHPVPAHPVPAHARSAPAGPARVVVPTSITRSQVPAGSGHPGLYQTGGHPTVPPARRGVDEPYARGRPPIGVLLLGLLIGLLVFGSTGYLVGSTAGGSTVDGSGETQEEANRRRIGPVLAPLAEGWVPWLGACLSNREAGGPAPYPGELSRVACAVDTTVDVFFVRFASAADRDAARAVKQSENAASATLAAGAAPVVAQRAGTSGRTTGAYIEFANQRDGRTYGGIWWEDSGTTGAAYIEKVWTEGDGGWRPLRDLWQRYT
ncbi:hypothetical protein [Virgisporangium ochraceum]|nr:hypothetical protein [Virgisporangium ochraceum]